jgi:hypothetical protein
MLSVFESWWHKELPRRHQGAKLHQGKLKIFIFIEAINLN